MAVSDSLKRDSYIFGLILAVLTPVLSAVIFTALNYLFSSVLHLIRGVNDAGIVLLSLGMNLIFMRYCFLKFKTEKTGKAILAATFVFVILFFLFIRGKEINLIPFN